MKKKHSFFVTMGIPSLFLIFSVLCLAVLSLLTLGTSRTDLRTSRLSMEQTEGYFQACAAATELCQSIEAELTALYKESANEQAYFSSLDSLKEKIPQLASAENADLTLVIPCSDTQELLVELQALYPNSDEDTFYSILTWKTQTSGSWNPDTRQPVFKGEHS